MLIIAGVLLVIFLPKKVPEIVKGLGHSIVDFKKSMREARELESDLKRDE